MDPKVTHYRPKISQKNPPSPPRPQDHDHVLWGNFQPKFLSCFFDLGGEKYRFWEISKRCFRPKKRSKKWFEMIIANAQVLIFSLKSLIFCNIKEAQKRRFISKIGSQSASFFAPKLSFLNRSRSATSDQKKDYEKWFEIKNFRKKWTQKWPKIGIF